MQVVTLLNLTHVLSHLLNTMSKTIFSNPLIFQEFAKLKYTLNLKISKSQNLTNAKFSRLKVFGVSEDIFLAFLFYVFFLNIVTGFNVSEFNQTYEIL